MVFVLRFSSVLTEEMLKIGGKSLDEGKVERKEEKGSMLLLFIVDLLI